MRNLLNLFYQYKISNKIAVIFLILLAMMGIGGSVGLYNARQIADITRKFYTDFFSRQNAISLIEKELLSENGEVLLYLINPSKDTRRVLETSLKGHRESIQHLFEDYVKAGNEKKGLQEARSSFEKALSDYRKTREEALSMADQGDREKSRELFRDTVTAKFSLTRTILERIFDEEWNGAFREHERAKHLSAIITWLTISLTVLAIIASAGLWLMLSRSIVRPIETLHDATKRIEHGDLTERVAITSKDEIGTLASEFNRMAEYLEHYYSDIIKKKQEMEILNEELARANKTKSQFVATVSHELRTPLNSIIGFSELLSEKSFGELNDKQMQYVNYINASGVHLSDLINDILDLSKIEAGRLELAYEEFPVVEVIEEVLGSIKPMASKRGVTVGSSGPAALESVKLDRAKFKQIMLNLMSNAVKFNREGGRVDIQWEIANEPKGGIIERGLRVSVKDTGIGIRQEDASRIFREFEQLDQSVTRDYGGTGLGLALTKKLVELHNGWIWFDSEYGKGTTFTFIIPQAIERGAETALLAEEIKEAERPEPSFQDISCPTILVASDSDIMSEVVKKYLEENCYRVELAWNGKEALEKAEEVDPFAIVIDIDLPEKDGWEVMKELKKSPRVNDTPIIMITAANEKEIGFSLGAVDYLEKPIQKDKLIETLQRLSFIQRRNRSQFCILAIDDEQQVLEFLGDILEPEGFSVIKTTNGEEGIATAIERDPDLIILDLMMPRVSGFDVVERLREHPTARDIPILIFTAKEITADDKVKLGDSIMRIIKKADFSKKGLLSEIRKLEMAYPVKAKVIDTLTRTFNQRYFFNWAEREIARSNRYGQPFGVLMLDVDRFKQYNEKNGFLLGNEVLVDLARLIESNIRKADCLIRCHGDCFVLLLPGIAKEGTALVGEKLRIRVQNGTFPSADGKKNGKISVSIGIASYPMDGKGPDELMANAEEAVKSAFQIGGNRVSVFKRA